VTVDDRAPRPPASAALDALPPIHRNVLRLRLIHGLSAEETARALDVHIRWVHHVQHRALDTLRRSLPANSG